MTIQVDEQLVLRTYQPYDAPELFACVAANRAHLSTFLPWVDSTLKVEDSLEFIRNALVQETAQKGLSMGIFNQDALIGGIGMHQWNHYLQSAQIGYWLTKAAEGQGLMLRCVTAFITFLFEQLSLNKVEIHFLPHNSRSARLVQRLGAKTEGLIRDSIRINGGYGDVVITGILKREWAPHRVPYNTGQPAV